MFRFLLKTLLRSGNGYAFKTQNPSMAVSFSLRYFSTDAKLNQLSFTVSYLIESCGLSPKSALSACKSVQFESSEQPDSVLSSFKKFGFSKTQISEMVRKYPKLLYCNPKKTISPKVEFFRSKGASTPDLVRIFTINPWILQRSLENQLVPTFNILIELFQSEEKAIEGIKQNPQILSHNLETGWLPNINTLRENGVPESNVLLLLRHHWWCLGANTVNFNNIVGQVKEMGFNPLKSHFVVAIMVFTVVSKSKRDQKVEIFKRWDWSDEDITTAFKKFPRCMGYSDDKLMAAMEFFVNKIGLKSSIVANRPLLLGYSLKKRLIPRGAVIQFLSSKGLVKLNSSIADMFVCPERRFMEKYAKSPHLQKLYKEKLELYNTTQSAKVDE